MNKRLLIPILSLISTLCFSSTSFSEDAPYSDRHDVADYMTCNEAIEYYDRFELIYVLIHHRGEVTDIVPLYGMTPINQPKICRGRKTLSKYKVDTLDTHKCYIAKFCA